MFIRLSSCGSDNIKSKINLKSKYSQWYYALILVHKSNRYIYNDILSRNYIHKLVIKIPFKNLIR